MEFNLMAITGAIKEQISKAIKVNKGHVPRGRSKRRKTARIHYYRITLNPEGREVNTFTLDVDSLDRIIKYLENSYHDLNEVIKLEECLRIIECQGKRPENPETIEDVTKEYYDMVKRLCGKDEQLFIE